MTPTAFGKYLLLERLAQGGMAEVFRAVYRGTAGFEKTVALKRILPVFHDRDEFVTMFCDEARLAATLTHVNIAQVFEFGNVDGAFYLTMELVEGADVGRIIEAARRCDRPLPSGLAAFVLAEAARGLHYAHEKRDGTGAPLGLVHRDVSPQNILVSYAGEVKIADFGIAKAAGKLHKTASGAMMGKLRYMSPEQITGSPLDARSDIFAAGAVLYELATLQPLWDGDNPGRVADQVKEAQFRPPSAVAVAVPPALDAICQKALARERGARYPHAAELARELSSVAHAAGSGFGREDLGAFLTDLIPKAERARVTTVDAVAQTLASTAPELASAPTLASPTPTVPEKRRSPSDAPAATRAAHGRSPTWAAIGIGAAGAMGLGWKILIHAPPATTGAKDKSPSVADLAAPRDAAPGPYLPAVSLAERQRLIAALEALPQAEAAWRGVEAADYLAILSAVDAALCAPSSGESGFPPEVAPALAQRRLTDEAKAVLGFWRVTGELPPRVATSLHAFLRTRPAYAQGSELSGGWALAGLAARIEPDEPRHRLDLLRQMSMLRRWRPETIDAGSGASSHDASLCERRASVASLATMFPSPRAAALKRYVEAAPVGTPAVAFGIKYVVVGAERDPGAARLDLTLRIENPTAADAPLSFDRARLYGAEESGTPTVTPSIARIAAGQLAEVRLRFAGITDMLAEAAVLGLGPSLELAAYSEVLR
jgi:serine/threonine protein kinase